MAHTHSMDDHGGHHPAADADKQHQADTHDGHSGHNVDHTGHELMFRNRFWVSLALTVPVLLYSETIQDWLNFTMPTFPGSQWITPLFSVIIFLYGGVPFLKMAAAELKDRQPGMMTLISLAITVAFVYSLATVFVNLGRSFFWELVTLIDVMLLGHWLTLVSQQDLGLGKLKDVRHQRKDAVASLVLGDPPVVNLIG